VTSFGDKNLKKETKLMNKTIKKLFVLLMAVIMVVGLAACNPNEKCTVTFKNGDQVLSSFDVDNGAKLTAEQFPSDPTASGGYKFDGWYVGSQKVEVGYEVKNSITVEAKFVLDVTTCEVKFTDCGEQVASFNLTAGTSLTTAQIPANNTLGFDGWYAGSVKAAEGYVVNGAVEFAAKYNLPLSIANETDLKTAAALIAKNYDNCAEGEFKLTADVVLTDEFEPIVGFKGTFDGNFHKISELSVNSDGANVGLFATLDGATVKNLTLEATDVSNTVTTANVGILAGSATDSTIECVTVNGTLSATGAQVVAGGIVGTATNSMFLNVVSNVQFGAGSVKLKGGIVGNLGDKAVVENAYSSANVAAVAEKAADSAVAFVLVKAGDVVGNVLNSDDVFYNYVIGCKVGANAAVNMGWNDKVWNTTGAEPVLKTDVTAPTVNVTVDGNPVASAAYGAKLATSLFPTADADNKAFVGYTVGGEMFYPALPVLNNITLNKVEVDYSAIAGALVPVKADGAALNVAEKVTFGALELTRSAVTKDGMEFAFYLGDGTDAYRLTFKALDSSEKTSLGYTVEGAALVVVEKKVGNAFGEAAFYMPAPVPAVVGAWTVNENTVIYSAEPAAAGGFKKLVVGESESAFKTCFVIDGANVAFAADNFTAAFDGTVPVLKKNDVIYSLSETYFAGKWISVADSQLVDVTGFEKVATADGCGFKDTANNVVYVANLNGFLKVTENAKVQYVPANFNGEFISIVDGAVTTLAFEGEQVRVNDRLVDYQAQLADGMQVKLTFTANETNYALVKDGANFVAEADDSVVFVPKSLVDGYFGEFILGSVKFTLGNDGSLAVDSRDGMPDALTLVYANNKVSLSADKLVFNLDNGKMYLNGYVSELTGAVLNNARLFKADDLAAFNAAFNGDYFAPNGKLLDETATMNFSGGVLTYNGVQHAFEYSYDVNNVLQIQLVVAYEGKDDNLISLKPAENGLVVVGNISIGAFFPAAMADAVGDYYEFLESDDLTENAPAPEIISLRNNGNLSINGISYAPSDYKVTENAGVYSFEITRKIYDDPGTYEHETDADPNLGKVVAINVNNKTLKVDGGADFIGTRVLPVQTYSQVGESNPVTLEVSEGRLGYIEEDSEDPESSKWIAPVYPLYGFKYAKGGAVGTSKSFTWAKSGATVTVTINVDITENSVTSAHVLTVTVTDGNYDNVSFSLDGTEAIQLVGSDLLARGSYVNVNGDHTFEILANGIVMVNGAEVDYDYNTEDGMRHYVVGGSDYVVDPDAPEIAKCNGETLYDVRFAHLAGLKLVSFRMGDKTADKKFTMELTEDGWKFNGTKVDWIVYDAVSENVTIRFSVDATADGITDPVEWKFESNNSIMEFGIQLYPNQSYPGDSGWPDRWFVPELLLDAGAYKTTDDTIVQVTKPDYSDNSFTPFVFAVGLYDSYNYRDYVLSTADGVITVKLADDHVLTFAKNGADVVATLDGVPLTAYELPALADFSIGAEGDVKTGLSDRNNHQFYISSEGIWEYSQYSYIKYSKISVYTPYVFDGKDALVFGASSQTRYAAIKVAAGNIKFVDLEVLGLIGTYNCDGKTFVVGLDYSGEIAKITVSVDGTPVPDADILLNTGEMGDGYEYFLKLTAGGQTYYVVKDYYKTENEKAFVVSEALKQMVAKETVSGYQISAWITLGAGDVPMIQYTVKVGGNFVPVNPMPVDGKEGVYSVTFDDADGVSKTIYFAHFASSDPTDAILAVSDEQLAYIGTHTVSDVQYVIAVESVNDETIFTFKEGEKAAVEIEWKSDMNCFYFADSENVCYIKFDDSDVLHVNKVSKAQSNFITTSSGYYTFGDSSKKATVAFNLGEFVVTYNGNPTTNVAFNDDSTQLSFTQDSANYVIFMTSPTAFSEYGKAEVLTEADAKYIGQFNVNEKVLSIGLYNSYGSISLKVTYDGDNGSEVKFVNNVVTFKISGQYYAAYFDGDVMKVDENILDTTAFEYELVGKTFYSPVRVEFGFEVQMDGGHAKGVYTCKNPSSGADIDYSYDADTLVLTIDGKNCYVSGSSLKELTADEYARLGAYTVDTHTVTLMAGNKVKLDSNAAVAATLATDASNPAKNYFKFTAGGKTYVFFVVDAAAKTATLSELTADQVAALNLSTSVSVNGSLKYLKGAIVFNDQGAFTLSKTFDGVAIANETAIADFGYSFESAATGTAGNTYYVCTNGTSAYIVTADQYAWYTASPVTVGTNNVHITAGTSSAYMFMVSLDGAAAVKGEYKVSGYPYIQFKVGDDTYVLTRNTESDNAFVLTKLSADQAAALAASSKQIMYWNGTAYDKYAYVKGSITVAANGTVSVSQGISSSSSSSGNALSFDLLEDVSNPALNLVNAFKITSNGKTYYSVSSGGSYPGFVSEGQFALFGTYSVQVDDGNGGTVAKDFTIRLKSSNLYLSLEVVLGTDIVTGGDCYSKGDLADAEKGAPVYFVQVEVGGATVDAVEFQLGGKTYQAYFVSGQMTVVEKAAA